VALVLTRLDTEAMTCFLPSSRKVSPSEPMASC
jgi:hypothetical protein